MAFKVSLMVDTGGRHSAAFLKQPTTVSTVVLEKKKKIYILSVSSLPPTRWESQKLKLVVGRHESCDEAARLARTFSKSSLLRRFSVMLLLSSNFGRMTAMYPLVDGCARLTEATTLKCLTEQENGSWIQNHLLNSNKAPCVFGWKHWDHNTQVMSGCFYLLQQERWRF